MRKIKELELELSKEKAENLSRRNKLVAITDLIKDYEETKGNAFTYMRKIANIIRYE